MLFDICVLSAVCRVLCGRSFAWSFGWLAVCFVYGFFCLVLVVAVCKFPCVLCGLLVAVCGLPFAVY